MKKIFLIVAVFYSLISFSQKNFQGKAIYQSKTKMNMNFGNRDISEEQKKRIKERMKSFSERTYTLQFNGEESLYKEEERLSGINEGRGARFQAMMSSFSGGVQYKNIKKNEFLESKEFFGKQFLISDEAKEIKWVITGETKQIGKYTCLKATTIKEVNPVNFGRFRPRNKKTDAKENPSEKKTVVVTAWYTPQIPVSNGPGMYNGLPGLILEVNEGNTTILCSEIVLNTSANNEIKKPTKGKEVSREEYNKIAKKKMEEMREMFQRRRGGRNGRGRGRF